MPWLIVFIIWSYLGFIAARLDYYLNQAGGHETPGWETVVMLIIAPLAILITIAPATKQWCEDHKPGERLSCFVKSNNPIRHIGVALDSSRVIRFLQGEKGQPDE